MATETLEFDPLRWALHNLNSAPLDETYVDCTGQNAEEIRKRYRDLESPCYGFLAALRDANRLDLLVERANLESVPSLRPVPFRIPRPPIDAPFVEDWSPGDAQDTDDATACSRLLLWFAVAHQPLEFAADLLYWQQVQKALPLYRPDGGPLARPIVRIKIGVYESARGLFESILDGATVKLDTDKTPPQNSEVKDPDLHCFQTISAIARHAGVDESTIRRWRKKGRLQIHTSSDGTYICSLSQLAMQRDARKRKN